jgi:hypothetical protein
MEGLGYLALYHAFFSLKTNKAAKPNGENFPYSLPQNLAKLTGLKNPLQSVIYQQQDAIQMPLPRENTNVHPSLQRRPIGKG